MSATAQASKVGELLVHQGLITDEQFQKAAELSIQNDSLLNLELVKLGVIEESEIVTLLGQEYGLPTVDLENEQIDQDVVDLIPQKMARKHNLLPLYTEGNKLTVAMADPSNVLAVNDIKFISGKDVVVVVAPASQLKTTIDKQFEENVSYDGILNDLDDEGVEVVNPEDDVNVGDLEKSTEDAPVVKLVNAVLMDAIKKNASDIHIEPYEKAFRVRFRIDGVLYEIMKPPLKLKNAITSRLKIMADLDIAERRLPQDGRIKLKLGSRREMDFRVSVLPGLFGEKVVLRLLDKSNLQTDMTKLGFSDEQMTAFEGAIKKPYGLVLVTGPTGSGKTTTLYSALSELNTQTVNISTAEDPVEFNLPGINQTQTNDDIGLNFAAALRSFLRQDPDIVMVGEIRDYETAEIAIKASLTGHLVLSTLHTNDAPSTVNRLLNMGVEPFLVASSVNIIVAQRLARRICGDCKEEVKLSPEVLMGVGLKEAEAKHTTTYYGKGCSKCSGTGYKGRVAFYECMVITEELKDFILNGASTAEIKREAIRQGMETLRASGIRFLKDGVTTVEEVLRVTVADD